MFFGTIVLGGGGLRPRKESKRELRGGGARDSRVGRTIVGGL